jgi:hypothetical protein
MRQKCPLSVILLTIVLEILTRAVRQEKNKSDTNRKSSIIITVCRYDTIHKRYERLHQKILTSDKHYNVAGYKINIQKSVAFLQTNIELAEKQQNSIIHNSLKN